MFASKAAPCATGRARTAADNQCRSRQAPSEHARPVLGQRTMVVIETNSVYVRRYSVRNVRPHNARTRVLLGVSKASCGSSLQRNDAGVWLCEYLGPSFQRCPVRACSLVSSLLLNGATMSQQSSLTQSAHSVRQVLTAYTWGRPEMF
jgi:hypothetical protein